MKIRYRKEQRSKPWLVDLGLIEGKRQRKFFETKADAQSFLEAKKLERTNLGTHALTLTHEERSEYLTAKAKLAGRDVSLVEVADYYVQNSDRVTPKELGIVIDECITAKTAAGKRKRYVHHLDTSLGAFRLGREHKLITEIQPGEIEAWLNAQGWALPTRRGYLIDIQTLFNFARKRGYCWRNPAKAVEKPTPEDKEPGVLTVLQVRALLRAGLQVDKDFTAGYIAPVLFGGVRVAEVLRLTQKEIRETVLSIIPSVAKTRERRDIERTGTLGEWLKLCKGWPIKNWEARLYRVEARAAVELFGQETSKEFPWPQNCLRHSFCSYGVVQFGAKWTAERAGHSEDMLFKKYRAMVSRAEAEEFWRLTPKQVKKAP